MPYSNLEREDNLCLKDNYPFLLWIGDIKVQKYPVIKILCLKPTRCCLYIIMCLLAYNETSIIILWIFEVYKSDVHWKKEWKCYKLSVLGLNITDKSDKL